MQKKPWRVRVTRRVEDWVEVTATSAAEAEAQARNYAGVLSVITGVTTPADKPLAIGQRAPVEDPDQDE